jgi:hypothetical protein
MGFMLSRPSFSATLADALEKGRQNLSEYKGLEMVLDCSRCYTRLAPLEWTADRWTVVTPADRFVSPFFGSPYVRCRICGERSTAECSFGWRWSDWIFYRTLSLSLSLFPVVPHPTSPSA